MVNPVRAPHVVTDLEDVALLKGGSGELDKTNPSLRVCSQTGRASRCWSGCYFEVNEG